MSYSAEVSRKNPACFLFLIDQSGSMDEPMSGAEGKRKADCVADTINRLLQTLVIRATKQPPTPWDYFEVGVIGYGAEVGPAFSGALASRALCTISEIYNTPARVIERTKKVPDGAGGTVEQSVKFPIWFDPVAGNGTPMVDALGMARDVLGQWIARNQSSYPPIAINITDGEADGDPVAEARRLTALSTSDGNVMLFNCHISKREAAPVLFPNSDAMLPDQYARQLFAMSTELPPPLVATARAEGITMGDGARGFAFNADLVELIRFVNIGTRPSNDLR